MPAVDASKRPTLPVNRPATTPALDGRDFRVPRDLEVVETPVKRVLLVGQCILNAWKFELEHRVPGLSVEQILFNFTSQLPVEPPLGIEQYDFQIIALPMRGILPESKFLGLSYLDEEATARLFEETCEKMSLFLRTAMKWNTDFTFLTFIGNFLVPQQNPMGRLMPRYDLRNMVCFVERLNERLVQEIGGYTNAHLLDIDQVAASIGRRFVQDDVVSSISHGSVLANFADDKDMQRIEPPALPITKLYNSKVGAFIEEVWREAVAMFRTLRQIDMVKMVIVDLDDTLWRGVLAEAEQISGEVIEGWPLGVIEALSYLRNRGVLLAIVSKNEEANVSRIFENLLRNRLPLESFALRRINWRPKVENIQEILTDANLLPGNVVMVDDNPVERAAIAAAFPDLRLIGADPYVVKRILLWSPETQTPTVTRESARRGEMVQAQVRREKARKVLSREDFLKTLEIKVRIVEITTLTDPHFDRALELINKTNQYNTTGARWSVAQIGQGFQAGLTLVAFFVEDTYTDYGLVGVLLVRDNSIEQFVMSCRVLGLDVEKAVLSRVLGTFRDRGAGAIRATLKETVANFPCRTLYSDNGFIQNGQTWTMKLAETKLATPSHVLVTQG